MKTRSIALFAAAALPALFLAACSGDSEPREPIETEVDEVVIEEPVLNLPDPTPEPLPTQTATPTPTPEPLPDDEQVQFDAEATGMTARIDRNAPAEDAPVEPVQE